MSLSVSAISWIATSAFPVIFSISLADELVEPMTRCSVGFVVPIPTFPVEETNSGVVFPMPTWKIPAGAVVPMPTLPFASIVILSNMVFQLVVSWDVLKVKA